MWLASRPDRIFDPGYSYYEFASPAVESSPSLPSHPRLSPHSPAQPSHLPSILLSTKAAFSWLVGDGRGRREGWVWAVVMIGVMGVVGRRGGRWVVMVFDRRRICRRCSSRSL